MLKNISFCVNTVLVNLKKNIASIIFGLFRKTRTKSNHYQKHIQNSGVARARMKYRHQIRRGVWGPLKAPSGSRAVPWQGVQGGEAPRRKTDFKFYRTHRNKFQALFVHKILSFLKDFFRSKKAKHIFQYNPTLFSPAVFF